MAFGPNTVFLLNIQKICLDNCYFLTASKSNVTVDALLYEKSHGFPSSMMNIKKTPKRIPQTPGTQIAGKKK